MTCMRELESSVLYPGEIAYMLQPYCREMKSGFSDSQLFTLGGHINMHTHLINVYLIK